MTELENLHPDEVIMSKIYLIRGQKVMLDSDLAELYGVETRVLNQAVKRNSKRFPLDFMFQLTPEEWENMSSQIVMTSPMKRPKVALPSVFSEHGTVMLASVLKSDRAIHVNIQIIRIYTRMREMLLSQKEILQKLEELQRNDIEHDKNIKVIFEYLKQFERSKQQDIEQANRKKIGFVNQ